MARWLERHPVMAAITTALAYAVSAGLVLAVVILAVSR